MPHPFDSVTESEVRLASKLIKDAYPALAAVHFVQIDKVDPPKQSMKEYLAAEHRGEAALPQIPRVLYAYYYTNTLDFNKALVNVSAGHIITKSQQPQGTVGPFLPDDMMEWEDYCNRHPAVLAEVAKLRLPAGYTVRNDPWIYATDSPTERRPLVQFFMYVLAGNGHTELNHYLLPLKFLPVFEAFTKKFIRMDYLPAGFDETTVPTQPWQQVECVEYHPDLNGEDTLSRDIRPLLISQPEGPSFVVDGLLVQWQGWRFRVLSLAREGVVVYDGLFKGRLVFYRIALSEMTVPYGDPRAPYHRKQAFDLGDCGFGVNGNHLALGCDCLGVIKYLDGVGINGAGEPHVIPNTICMHEQDNGLLYKHVNYRTNNAVVARKREFIVQTIATVANYEYIINLKFVTDGSLDIETRATGILLTMPIDPDLTVPWGTVVGPNVMAAYHQHILLFRIDPAVDGHRNTVVFDDVVKLPRDERKNPFGVGFVTDRKFVERAGLVAQSPFTNRTYKIINENVINPVLKTAVGYKVEIPPRQMILADADLFNVKRARFATEAVWVTKYRDHELFAAGEFTNQSQRDTGLGEWANGTDVVRNEDLVVWATLGFTHIPRVEDFPVMPVETHTIHLQPNNFFNKNPALDLPQATNAFNKSSLVKTNETAAACCKNKI